MADQTERLKLIVDAATSDAESGFRRLTGEAQSTQAAADNTGKSVAAAADAVAQARLKEQDAAGKLSVAEVRLQELRDSGTAKASTIAAAEERVASSQRNLQVATSNTARAVEQQNTVNSEAATRQQQVAASTAAHSKEQENLARSSGLARDAIRGLVTVGAGLLGIGLVAGVRDAVTGFVDGARAAGQFAIATNSSTAEASRLLGLVGSLGLDFNDLLEIQAEFAQKSDGLSELGVTLQRNADGTVNWTRTLEDTLVALQGIPDATDRNAAGFSFFGEEGYKQLSRLVNTGQDVSEVIDAIGTPFDDGDVQAAADYDQALRDASLAGGELERTLGRALLPVLADVAGGLGDGVDFLTSLNPIMVVGAGAAAALAITGFSPAAVAGERLAIASAAASTQLAVFRANAATTGAAGAVLAAGTGAAAGAARGLLSIVGGPLGATILAVATAFTVAQAGAKRFQDAVEDAARDSLAADQAYGDQAASVEELGQRLYDAAGGWDQFAAGARGYADAAEEAGGLTEFLSDIGFNNGLAASLGGQEYAVREFTNGIEEAKDELGAFGAQQETAQTTTKTLTDLIAEGTTSGTEFADAVRVAADAQNAQATSSGLAEAAIAAYNATTTGAVDATLGLINAQLGQADAYYGFLGAVDAANAAVDDTATLVDEVAQANTRVVQSALTVSGAAADAAVAAATANGTILTGLAEAQIRADATIGDLQARLNQPGLGDAARAEIQGIIDQLTVARDNGTIEATLQTLGLSEATSEIDTATEDRDTNIQVESRGGPAVIAYLNGIAAATYLALVKVESRNGPAVISYLAGIADATRLALIMTESRGGPAVNAYLAGIAGAYRLAIINVESRGGPAVESYLDTLARTRTATINVRQQAVGAPVAPGAGPSGLMGATSRSGMLTAASAPSVQVASVSLDLELSGSVDRQQLSSAERGRAFIRDIQAAERTGGARWRKT